MHTRENGRVFSPENTVKTKLEQRKAKQNKKFIKLPNIRELKSIVDTTKSRPAMNSIFTNVGSTDFWSATTSMSDANNAWVVGFYRGLDYWASKTLKDYVRCVRGGV